MRLEQLIQGDDSVQQLVASEREKATLLAVSPMARKAIEREILPQLDAHVTSAKAAEELAEDAKKDIEAAFKSKSEIYTRLIGYKSIDQSDDQYLKDLLYVMDEWAERTKKVIDGVSDGGGQVTFKVEIESDVNVKSKDVKVDGVDTEVTVKDTAVDESLPVSITDIFDIGDVRL